MNFEELTCVGLNPLTNRLGAVIHVKKNNGYNGNLCTSGSVEHVAFWADWNNNGTYDQYLGTAAVRGHDISNIPKGGLFYTVHLPLDVTNRLRLCSNPNVISIGSMWIHNEPAQLFKSDSEQQSGKLPSIWTQSRRVCKTSLIGRRLLFINGGMVYSMPLFLQKK